MQFKNKRVIAVSLIAASVVSAQAVQFSFVNKYDNTISTASATNLNRSFGATSNSTTVTTANQSWWQFDGAAMNTQLTGTLGANYVISSITLNYFTLITGSPSSVAFHFNSNGSWLGDISAASLDPATTPQLTFNDSGQTQNGFVAVNGRFLGSDVSIANKSITSADHNKLGSVDLSASSNLNGAITGGTSFTLMAKPNSIPAGSVVSFVQKEGVATVAGSIAPTLVIEATAAPVPEPATLVALGVGAAALLRRRKR